MRQIENVELQGSTFPIAVNWNTISTYEEVSGKSIGEWEDLAASSAQGGDPIPAKEILHWAYASMKEGARIEKKEFNLSLEDVGSRLTPSNSAVFITAFTKLYTGGYSDESQHAKKKDRS